MTTTQTIDGVPREKLRDVLNRMRQDQVSLGAYGDELRALLDAPTEKCNKCYGAGKFLISTVCGTTHKACDCIKPAAQPQGEPVLFVRPQDLDLAQAIRSEISIGARYAELSEYTVPLYAEQPAPVAVVLPERFHQVIRYLMGSSDLDGYYFRDSHPSGRKYWWRNELRACLDEVTRLNPSL